MSTDRSQKHRSLDFRNPFKRRSSGALQPGASSTARATATSHPGPRAQDTLSVPVEPGYFVIDEFLSEAGESPTPAFPITDEPSEELDPALFASSFPPAALSEANPTPLHLMGVSYLNPVNNMSLSEFCNLVSSHRSLQHAEIPTTEAYTEPLGPVVHRFLLLELRPAVGSTIWLRLDRRTGKSKLQIVLSRGTVPAHDTAQLASDKHLLVGPNARRENRQVFTTVPTLGELYHLLQVIVKELTEYQVWPANCWFFLSLIQQHLEGANRGRFVAGSLPYANLARNIRERIASQLRLFYHMPTPFSLTGLLQDLIENHKNQAVKSLSRAHELSVMWDSSPQVLTEQGRKLARILAESLHETARQLNEIRKGKPEAGVFWKHAVLIFQQLYRQDADRSGADYVGSLLNYSRFLYSVHRTDEVQVWLNEALTVQRQLHERDPDAHKAHLAFALNVYAVFLRASDRLSEASSYESQARSLRAGQHQRQLSQPHSSAFVWTLHDYTSSLHMQNRGEESYISSAGDVANMRQLYAVEPERHRTHLAKALHTYGLALNQARLGEAACMAQSEAVSLLRILASRDPEQHDVELAAALQAYASSLRLMGRVEEACTNDAAAVGLRRELFARDAARHRLGLASANHSYAISLFQAERIEEARIVEGETVQILRALYGANGASGRKHAPILATALNNYGLLQHAENRIEDACETMAEAVNLRRQLHERDAERYRSDLAFSLTQYSRSLLSAGRIDDACSIGKEAVTTRRLVYVGDRDRHRIDYLSALGYYSVALMTARRFDEANAPHAKLVEHYRILWERDPDTYRRDLRHWLLTFAKTLRYGSRPEEALKAEKEARLLVNGLQTSVGR